MKLYRSAVHPDQWLAYGKEIGWVVFPASENGWEARRPARGIDPVHLREVPLALAASASCVGIRRPHRRRPWRTPSPRARCSARRRPDPAGSSPGAPSTSH